jgi:hypothetical protein
MGHNKSDHTTDTTTNSQHKPHQAQLVVDRQRLARLYWEALRLAQTANIVTTNTAIAKP